jgi:hypothetical protein
MFSAIQYLLKPIVPNAPPNAPPPKLPPTPKLVPSLTTDPLDSIQEEVALAPDGRRHNEGDEKTDNLGREEDHHSTVYMVLVEPEHHIVCKHCFSDKHSIDFCRKLQMDFSILEMRCRSMRRNRSKVRRYLHTVPLEIIRKYVQYHRLSVRLSIGYCEYYDANVMQKNELAERLIEMIVMYLCVVPYRPELKKSRYERVLENSFLTDGPLTEGWNP